MAKRNYQKIDINLGAFTRALESRNLDGYKMAEEMGFKRKYLWNKARLGYVHMNDVVLLDKIYGIPREEYDLENNPVEEPKPEQVAAVEPVVVPAGIDYDRLYDTIFKAVFRAVKLAWEDGDLPEEEV